MIRRMLDSQNQAKSVDPMHSGHCIDQIRQYIMCAGDLTPIPSAYYSGLGSNYVLSDQMHTCRNFDQIRQWLTNRHRRNNVTE